MRITEADIGTSIFDCADPWWWLSFAGEFGHLGVAIVRGSDITHAVNRAWDLGCNPGGEVYGVQLPPDMDPLPDTANRLMTKEQAAEHYGPMQLVGEAPR